MRHARVTTWWRFPLVLGLVIVLIKPQLNCASTGAHSALPFLPNALAELSSPGATYPLEQLAGRDPLALLRLARQRCEQTIRDYRCLLLRQENLAGELTRLQRIEMLYRARPHSVSLVWIENADKARRALYVRGRDLDDSGEELALVEPANSLVRVVAAQLRIRVNGSWARASSRRTLDQAGYEGSFAAMESVHTLAAQRGELNLRYMGIGSVDGRPTYVLARFLPYTGDDGVYPNACLILHLDCEWLLPVGVYTFADQSGRELLGSYTMTQVQPNQGLGDEAFQF